MDTFWERQRKLLASHCKPLLPWALLSPPWMSSTLPWSPPWMSSCAPSNTWRRIPVYSIKAAKTKTMQAITQASIAVKPSALKRFKKRLLGDIENKCTYGQTRLFREMDLTKTVLPMNDSAKSCVHLTNYTSIMVMMFCL